METQIDAWRVELELRIDRPDPVGDSALSALQARGLSLKSLRSGRGYLLPADLPEADVALAANRLFADAVTESIRILAPGTTSDDAGLQVVVRRMAGVSDPEAASAERSLPLVGVQLPQGSTLETYRFFRTSDAVDSADFLKAATRALANPVIEEVSLAESAFGIHPHPGTRRGERVEVAIRELSDSQLLEVSVGMSLALTVDEMQAIRDFYLQADREPTDVELETLAQTWSEHCKHKTLTGPVRLRISNAAGEITEERTYSNLLKETVFAATEQLDKEWCWSVFKDNAGVIELTPDNGVAIKVETHNHPSALDPYGGAGTGIGGVIRDILGTGLGARPFAATDVFCVGLSGDDAGDLPPGTMHPDRILDGVIAGVRDYGNRMGIPTVCGTVIRHPGYTANPLVFAGCIGEIPRDCVDKETMPGDHIVAIGGRTGRDGIHGATFSSEALHEESETLDAASVQIGDPITEKKVLDVMMFARDQRLYSATTDCGAGGFSSAVGEMGEECGADVELSQAPLKYPGLSYWEIWISEAQERMVFSIPPDKLAAFQTICDEHEVECCVLGKFTDDHMLRLTWHGEEVVNMPMEFLHGGVPQPLREATWQRPDPLSTPWPQLNGDAIADLLIQVLGHPQVATKEWVVRQYDHEVQGGTVVKPYQGETGHTPGDGSVIQPSLSRPEGVALGCGIAPRPSEIDPYAGTACAIDEAMRNVVAAGGNPDRCAILDNFCWGDCRKPDRFGSLVLAAEACLDVALAYGTPFVSGKDSLNNEYRVGDQEKAIPPTLLCTAMAVVKDCAKALDAPVRKPGNRLALIGHTTPDGGGSVASDLLGLPDSTVPRPDLAEAPSVFRAIYAASQACEMASCHDLSEGGLAVAAAEMLLGTTRLGIDLDLSQVPCTSTNHLARLFTEGPTRFLVEVSADQVDSFAQRFADLPIAWVGEVTDSDSLLLRSGDLPLAAFDIPTLLRANGTSA